MVSHLPLAPRYRLDDAQPWLEGIDPVRNYWVQVNGDAQATVMIPGLAVQSLAELRLAIHQFRDLQAGDRMVVVRAGQSYAIHCVGENCYAVEGQVHGAAVWHLFDQETLESLLMTAHPDWKCAPKDVELGRRLLLMSLNQPAGIPVAA